MLVGLGAQEAHSILQETQVIEVGCDFCGAQYRFDSVDVEQLFHQPEQRPPARVRRFIERSEQLIVAIQGLIQPFAQCRQLA
jgi:hypothetical protein